MNENLQYKIYQQTLTYLLIKQLQPLNWQKMRQNEANPAT